MPGFVVDVLWRRFNDRAHPARGQHSINAVFASRNDTWLSPYNVGRQWREVRNQAGLEWVTLHVFRKTVATVLDDAGKTKEASRQLGHASEEVTKAYYIAKPKLVPDVTDVLDALGPRPRSITEAILAEKSALARPIEGALCGSAVRQAVAVPPP
ncbi:hypothetical protein Q0Z83_000180 [Actinoplanes sichuanensis]|nr:hypothetical protein Q0Z83_000180 [Actinoplanes sichuanensis]